MNDRLAQFVSDSNKLNQHIIDFFTNYQIDANELATQLEKEYPVIFKEISKVYIEAMEAIMKIKKL